MRTNYLVCDSKKCILAVFDNWPAADDYVAKRKFLGIDDYIEIVLYQVHSTVDELLAANAKAEV